ncbi:MAG: alcohol dehydrogenase AdhP [Yaniella sp.]|uniref:alcohol dehydrogenase AdhP n=1 Tax=Yaniella sp. TaxID=2773929 RepID=UPI00264A44D3|nr:alcohol dehydrogenase AdhP [Yaniella sp.]MDN5703849.1 alcohol dehydrogenase AdhP [Yaniella sp.]MDN5732066.1 alcohol dehydrogenase AdhP [Yaniella sp.]MDN5742125.1 alcohol dehydrogenase AdhP [Yaniella sp.]MDN5815877.1 alcohol dehydrogenase AdhP [Yaniella sp.]MDN5818455.1 alcohol dehydrogenase AdhP [Yaniella sp.]
MKAGIVKQFGKTIDIEHTDKPKPGKHEALVRLISTGVCHTDLHALEGDWPVKPSPPFIPGHEGVGEVVELGEDAVNFQVGDIAGNAWLWSACGNCEYCRRGWETLCHDQINGGYSVDGSFGEYMLIDTRYAPKIPEGSDLYEVGPVLCAGVTVYKGLKMSEAKPGDWVVISGIGGLGHLAVQYGVAMGLRVIAVDIADDKLELAKKHGAEIVINAADTDPAAAVQEQVGGAHAVLVTAVHEQAFGQAIGMSRRGGTIVFNGLPPGKFDVSVFDVVLNGLTVRGSIVGTRQDMIEALEFHAAGKIEPTYHRRPLEDLNDVFEEMRGGKIDGRVVIEY